MINAPDKRPEESKAITQIDIQIEADWSEGLDLKVAPQMLV